MTPYQIRRFLFCSSYSLSISSRIVCFNDNMSTAELYISNACTLNVRTRWMSHNIKNRECVRRIWLPVDQGFFHPLSCCCPLLCLKAVRCGTVGAGRLPGNRSAKVAQSISVNLDLKKWLYESLFTPCINMHPEWAICKWIVLQYSTRGRTQWLRG